MKKVEIFVNKNFMIGDIDRRIFGSFVEHMGRAVYTGIYEPGHPCADENGFRKDVIEAIKELNVSMVRYPGGNYVSGANWRDGIGENRPVRLGLAWGSLETNGFGIHEFSKWCKATNIEPMMAINVGTDSVKSAAEEVEYCNHDQGTQLSDLRIKNGAEKPFNFKLWCIGNEMDGDWQIGHLCAEDYGKKARECAKIMRLANGERWDTKPEDKLQLVVAGSSVKELPTFPDWDRIVLEYTYDVVDYLSMHRYYGYNKDGRDPINDFLGAPTDMDEFIKTIEGTINFVKAKNRAKKDIYISFDEWNIWNGSEPRKDKLWDFAPEIIEQKYTVLDSIVFAGLLNTLLNHSNIVKVACLAQLVNVIAPIITKKNGGLIKQTIFYPFALASNNASGKTVRSYNDSEEFDSWYGRSKRINQAITYDEKKKEICCFICNYDSEETEINIDLSSFGDVQISESKTMFNKDLFAINTFESKDKTIPVELVAQTKNNVVSIATKPYSYNYLKLRIK